MANVTQFLESLSNKELKDKCDEYNMKNIPVTNTTRSLLIRRLQTLMGDGKDTSTKQTKRRQTIQVVTTDVGLEDVEDDEDDDLNYTESRRLNQTFPKATLQKSSNTRTARSRKAANDLIESFTNATSTNDRRKVSEKNISLITNLNSKIPSDNINKSADSSKRSINLSRSAINTTSYCVEVEQPTPSNLEYEDYSDEDIQEDEEMEVDEGEYQFQNVQPNYSFPNNNEYNKQVQIEHNIEVNKHIPSRNSCLKKRNLSQMNISPNKARVSFYEPEDSKITYESSSRDIGTQQASFATYESKTGDLKDSNPTLYPFDMLNTAAKNMASSFASAPSYSPVTTTSGAFQRKSINNSFRTSYGLRDDDDSDNVVDSSSSGSEYENSNVSSKDKTKSKDFSNELKFNSTLNPSSIARSTLARRSLRPEDTKQSPMIHFTQMIKSLDHKYNISILLYFSLAFIVVLFILVFLLF